MKTENLSILKRLLSYIASITPGEVNTNNIAQHIQMSNQSINHYLTILNEVGLVRMVFSNQAGGATLRKPQKIFLNNTTLMSMLNYFAGRSNIKGTLRELFFIQSLNNANISVHYSKQGDYLVNEKIYEIGDKNKTKKQIKNSKKPAFLVKDDILLPAPNTIPLMLTGLLY